MIEEHVEIDQLIREHPDLLDAVQKASVRLAERSDSFGPNVNLGWKFARADKSTIELSITETTNTGTGFAKRQFPARYMNDPVSRDISVWQVWDDILADRVNRGLRRVGELITQIEEEEAVHAQ